MALTSNPRLEELVVGVVGAGGCLEQAAGAAAQGGEGDASALRLLRQPLREVERIVEQRLAQRGVLAHLGEDRALGARGDDRLCDPLDPDERTAAVPAAVVANRLDRVDLVGAGVLAETEED